MIGEALGKSLVENLGPDCSTATRLARAILASENGVLNESKLTGDAAGPLFRVLKDFEMRGWVQRVDGHLMCGTTKMPAGVPYFLDGAAAMFAALPLDSRATAVVTMPSTAGLMENALPRTGLSHSALLPSDVAFEMIADAAESSLTILTPFLNPDGLSRVLELFDRTSAPHKTLIVREKGGARQTALSRACDIADLGVVVRDYTLKLARGYETFHAKVVLADQSLAYVGSANMTKYEQNSVELGVLMDGKAARTIASVVRAIELVAPLAEVAQLGTRT